MKIRIVGKLTTVNSFGGKNKVFSVEGISPTLNTNGGGQREIKVFEDERETFQGQRK